MRRRRMVELAALAVVAACSVLWGWSWRRLPAERPCDTRAVQPHDWWDAYSVACQARDRGQLENAERTFQSCLTRSTDPRQRVASLDALAHVKQVRGKQAEAEALRAEAARLRHLYPGL
ncbi:MAG: hypothetical protein AB1758_04450 [Candidatus Eremiobacterota bacterium]